jgi:hypothetical protein
MPGRRKSFTAMGKEFEEPNRGYFQLFIYIVTYVQMRADMFRRKKRKEGKGKEEGKEREDMI